MNLKEMRAKVLAELEFIPKLPRNPQSDLRMAYFTARMHSLGKKAKEEKGAHDVLLDCIKLLKGDNPKAKFQYDEMFFKGKKGK
jgi:hypothetical protein